MRRGGRGGGEVRNESAEAGSGRSRVHTRVLSQRVKRASEKRGKTTTFTPPPTFPTPSTPAAPHPLSPSFPHSRHHIHPWQHGPCISHNSNFYRWKDDISTATVHHCCSRQSGEVVRACRSRALMASLEGEGCHGTLGTPGGLFRGAAWQRKQGG